MNNAQLKTETPNNVADSQPALDLNDQWVKDAGSADNVWHKNQHADESGYIFQYTYSKSFNWQSIKHQHRISGIADTFDEAIRKAEEGLALPIDEFNNLVAERYLEELHEIERKILQVKPAQKLLAGYHAGYEDGIAETTAKIAKALNLSDGPL